MGLRTAPEGLHVDYDPAWTAPLRPSWDTVLGSRTARSDAP